MGNCLKMIHSGFGVKIQQTHFELIILLTVFPPKHETLIYFTSKFRPPNT